MSRRRWAALALVVAGCGNFDPTDEGGVYLEVTAPPTLSIAVGETLQFSARVLDRDGEPLPSEIRWRTPDTTISVDPTGLVTGLFPGTGRIQAVTGNEGDDLARFIVSDFFPITVTEPPPPPEPATDPR